MRRTAPGLAAAVEINEKVVFVAYFPREHRRVVAVALHQLRGE